MAKIKEKLKTTVNCMARITLMRQMEVIYSLYLNKHWYDYTEASTSAESWIFFIKISKIERMSFYSFFQIPTYVFFNSLYIFSSYLIENI